MTQPFFITGLPCSRTAWLANLFTSGPVLCFHDLLGSVNGMRDFLRVMGTAAARTGDSDSGLLAAYAPIQQAFSEAPWVLIERDFEASWESLCRFVASGSWGDKLACTYELRESLLAAWEKGRAALMGNARVMHVPFESLERTDMLETMWKHCVPGMRFDRRRAEFLQTFSVRPFQLKAPIRPRLSLVRELYPVES